jgi:hypothetical protein
MFVCNHINSPAAMWKRTEESKWEEFDGDAGEFAQNCGSPVFSDTQTVVGGREDTMEGEWGLRHFEDFSNISTIPDNLR